MRYRWVIYYLSPLTQWKNPEAYASETIAEGAAPWRWLARNAMRNLYRQMNQLRCSCVLLENDVEIERHEAVQPDKEKATA